MTQVWNFVDPKPVGAKLENAAVGFLLDQWQTESVAIKGNGLLVSVRRTFDRDVGATGKPRAIEFRNYNIDLSPRFVAVKDAQVIFALRSWLFPARPRHWQSR